MTGFLDRIREGNLPGVRESLRIDPALAYAVGDDMRSALRVALDRGDHEMARLLIDHGAEPDPHEAVILGDIERLKWHVQDDPSVLERRDHQGWMLIHLSASVGRTGITRWLLRRGCSPSTKTRDALTETALHIAARRGYVDCVRTMCSTESAAASTLDADGRSALHIAAMHGHGDVASVLLASGADPMRRDAYGATPSQLAMDAGFHALAGALMSFDEHADERTSEGRSLRGSSLTDAMS